MLVFIVLSCFFFVNFCADDDCKFKLSTGQKFDFRKLPLLSVDLSSCGEGGHQLVFDVCKNIGNSDCPSQHTTGPGNACDKFVGGTTSYFWVGGMNKWTKSDYDKDKKEFTMSYGGLVQSGSTQPWTRNLEVVTACDKKVEYKISCISVASAASSTLYKVKLNTKHACTGGGYNFFWVVMGIGGIIWIILCCYFCCYLCAGGIVFAVMKIHPKLREKEYPIPYIILGFKYIKIFFWLQLQGWFILIDIFLFIKSKIKKEDYEPFKY